jgi:hypothetical protein
MAAMREPVPASEPRSAHETGPATPRARAPWKHRIARLGLVFRGLIYFVPGLLAMGWALARHGTVMSQTGVLAWISQQPLGVLPLALAAVGFIGYSSWGAARAVADPLHRGHGPRTLVYRIGYGASAIAYFGLFLATVRLIFWPPARDLEPHADWTAAMLAHPFGGLFVALVGLGWIFGSGLAQVVQGVRGTFERDLVTEEMSRRERRWLMTLGRIGIVARGLVFTITGVLVVAASMRLRAHPGTGLDGALAELANFPGGRVLVGLAGAGLVTFAAYSVAGVRWMRMNQRGERPDARSHAPHEPHEPHEP